MGRTCAKRRSRRLASQDIAGQFYTAEEIAAELLAVASSEAPLSGGPVILRDRRSG